MMTPVSTEVFVNFVFLIWDFKISACRCSPDHGDLPHLGSWQWCRHHRLCATYGLCHLVALGAWSAIHPSNGPITAQFLRSVWKLHWKGQTWPESYLNCIKLCLISASRCIFWEKSESIPGKQSHGRFQYIETTVWCRQVTRSSSRADWCELAIVNAGEWAA